MGFVNRIKIDLRNAHMTVLAYDTYNVGGADIAYASFTGQVDRIYGDNVEINIGEIVFQELATLPPRLDPNYGYAYVWKALITTSPEFIASASMFKSNPPRYKIGHLTANTNSGTCWDDTWKFENQTTPLFKATFYVDNPNPGDGFPFGTIPLGESVIRVWQTVQGNFNDLLKADIRASYLGLFIDKPADIFVRVSYTAFLSFTSLDIIAAAPQPFVVVYP